MTIRKTTAMIAAITMLTVGACSKKAPETLPPAPEGTDTGTGTGTDPNAVVPGSQQDFIANGTVPVLAEQVRKRARTDQGRALPCPRLARGPRHQPRSVMMLTLRDAIDHMLCRTPPARCRRLRARR